MKHWHSELRTVRVKIAKTLQTLVIVDARCSTPLWKKYQMSKVDIAENSQLGRKIASGGIGIFFLVILSTSNSIIS